MRDRILRSALLAVVAIGFALMTAAPARAGTVADLVKVLEGVKTNMKDELATFSAELSALRTADSANKGAVGRYTNLIQADAAGIDGVINGLIAELKAMKQSDMVAAEVQQEMYEYVVNFMKLIKEDAVALDAAMGTSDKATDPPLDVSPASRKVVKNAAAAIKKAADSAIAKAEVLSKTKKVSAMLSDPEAGLGERLLEAAQSEEAWLKLRYELMMLTETE